MNFLKSVLSEPSSSSPPASEPPDSDPEDPTSSWPFGSSIFKSIASKSESFLGNYYQDIQDFTSGLRDETSVIREAASRALRDLPARLDSGAAIAQESLEAVGQSIDNVAEFIGKELNLASGDGFTSLLGDGNSGSGSETKLNVIGRPYSRLEAVIGGLQGDAATYCDEIDGSSFGEWKLEFRIEEKSEEIGRLLKENRVIGEIHDEVVPEKVDDETFWCRYFYRVEMAVKAEEARASIVKRAISGDEDEDFSWDVDDDTETDGRNGDSNNEVKDGLNIGIQEKGKRVLSSEVVSGASSAERDEKIGGELQMKGAVSADEENAGGKLETCSEKEGSDGKLGSDISIISSQRTSHAEDDMGWDEIEHIPSGDENKAESQKDSSLNVNDLRKRLNSAEEDEELTWDIEGEEDEHPVK